jgi:spore coat polysaccharide biosynthesis protein SpsF
VRVLGVLQARTTSSRLPAKVLAPILGRAMILRQIDRVARAKTLDRLVVATSDDASDDALAALLAGEGVAVHRGPLDDVLARFAGALAAHPADHVVRLTGDCPLADPAIIDATVALHLEDGADYTSNCARPTFPDGLDVEVIRADALREAAAAAWRPSEREHVTPFLRAHPERFRAAELVAPVDRSRLRLTVDTPADLAFARAVYEALHPANPAFDTEALVALLDARPDLLALNAGETRNEGYARSLAAEAAVATADAAVART